MPVITESANLGDLLKYEAPSLYSRDAVTVASGQNLALGAVVGLKTADGKVHALDPAATDGTETAAGVLLQTVDATGADAPGVLLARHGIVADAALVWPAGITTGQQTAAIQQLKDRGLLVRKGV
ncbi:MAG: head decoration protein [Nitrospinae bacterium]|nr:head decoration protein [Nitrospinota bacterium]